MVRFTEKQIKNEAAMFDLLCCTHSPGDGITRYRFFENPVERQTYFGPNSGMGTILRAKSAMIWLYGYCSGKWNGRL